MACLETKVCKWTGTRESAAAALVPLTVFTAGDRVHSTRVRMKNRRDAVYQGSADHVSGRHSDSLRSVVFSPWGL